MKVIGILFGIVGFKEPIEEYTPERRTPMQDVINLIRETYNFASYPVLSAGSQPPAILTFMSGKFPDEKNSFEITQLNMAPDGDIAAAANTEQSEALLDHLIKLLDSKLGYRLGKTNIKRLYRSDIVVEFDKGFGDYISALRKMETIVDKYAGVKERPHRIVRIGITDYFAPPSQNSLDALEAAEFLIERRIGHPFDSNRFFCTAPMTTKNHITALKEIEAAFKAGAGQRKII